MSKSDGVKISRGDVFVNKKTGQEVKVWRGGSYVIYEKPGHVVHQHDTRSWFLSCYAKKL